MSRLILSFLVSVGIVTISRPCRGAETKTEKLSDDETQAKYLRKSISYLGIKADRGVVVDEPYLRAIERAIRREIEIERFDYNEVRISSTQTIDQFIRELRDYVKRRAMDRSASEAEFDTRFKAARVYVDDVKRIMNSAYAYQVRVTLFSVGKYVCSTNAVLALANRCVPGEAGMKAELNATVTFYHMNLLDEIKPGYSILKEIQVDSAEAFFAYPAPPRPPRSGSDVQTIGAYKKQLSEYKKALSDMDSYTSAAAVEKAAGDLGKWLSKEMKKIPVFQLLTPVISVLSDGIEFMLGKAEGVGLDDTYDVNEFGMAGQIHHLGYVKVRKVGHARGTGEGTPSYAEKIKESRGIVGGELLVEHPMVGLSVGLHGILELGLYDLLGKEQGMSAYPGAGFFVDWDIADWVELPEVYLSFEGDVLFLGEAPWVDQVALIHLLAGVKKKWYANSLVFTLGLRGGVGVYTVGESHRGSPPIGLGGDAVLGLEYYIMPEFSLYLKAAGRYFTNPIIIAGGSDPDPELAIDLSLGVLLCF
ncbi:MAG TPA: hypothetical protein VM425_09645 [Myxococcota bacterium]|nr:hypothetical protein [Myxococcota bacterium]